MYLFSSLLCPSNRNIHYNMINLIFNVIGTLYLAYNAYVFLNTHSVVKSRIHLQELEKQNKGKSTKDYSKAYRAALLGTWYKAAFTIWLFFGILTISGPWFILYLMTSYIGFKPALESNKLETTAHEKILKAFTLITILLFIYIMGNQVEWRTDWWETIKRIIA